MHIDSSSNITAKSVRRKPLSWCCNVKMSLMEHVSSALRHLARMFLLVLLIRSRGNTQACESLWLETADLVVLLLLKWRLLHVISCWILRLLANRSAYALTSAVESRRRICLPENKCQRYWGSLDAVSCELSGQTRARNPLFETLHTEHPGRTFTMGRISPYWRQSFHLTKCSNALQHDLNWLHPFDLNSLLKAIRTSQMDLGVQFVAVEVEKLKKEQRKQKKKKRKEEKRLKKVIITPATPSPAT